MNRALLKEEVLILDIAHCLVVGPYATDLVDLNFIWNVCVLCRNNNFIDLLTNNLLNTNQRKFSTQQSLKRGLGNGQMGGL